MNTTDVIQTVAIILGFMGTILGTRWAAKAGLQRVHSQNSLDDANAIEQLQEALERQIASTENLRQSYETRITALKKQSEDMDASLRQQIRRLELAIGGPFVIVTRSVISTHPDMKVIESTSSISLAPGAGSATPPEPPQKPPDPPKEK